MGGSDENPIRLFLLERCHQLTPDTKNQKGKDILSKEGVKQ
jgi:hypothetical protein